MQKEHFLQALLEATYLQPAINIYDFGITVLEDNTTAFSEIRGWVHALVREKLVHYADDNHTTIAITNYGKYWMLHGGYLGYLRDEHDMKVKRNLEKQQHEERLLEARLKLTKYRLMGFWIAMIVSGLGLLLSVMNLWLYMGIKKP